MGLLALVGLVLLTAPTIFHPPPLLIWNASASAPIGLYAVGPEHPIARDDLVLAAPAENIRSLAAERRYLPRGVNLVKRVAGLPGDEICSHGAFISTNGERVARRVERDGENRPMPSWSGCHRLGAAEVFLLMKDVPDSFDGRYFGATPRRAIIGRLTPLWTR